MDKFLGKDRFYLHNNQNNFTFAKAIKVNPLFPISSFIDAEILF